MTMSADDWQKMTELQRQLRNDFRDDVKLLCQKEVSDAMTKHEGGSWAHNPVKAGAAGGIIITLIEGIRKFLHG